MDLHSIKTELLSDEYDFLRDDPRLGGNIILLGLGGSHAYGMETENSDIDVRGIATNTRRNILTGRDFKQVVETETDTTVYSLEKIVGLLCECNPNTIEILGLKPEHYLYLSDTGRLLVENRHLFLSKRAIHSFGGYANSQLRRMENKAARELDQAGREANVLKSIQHATVDYRAKYFEYPEDAIRLYLDKAVNPDLDMEIFMDLHLRHYPLRDYRSMWSEMDNVVKAYNKFGARNTKAVQHDKLGKHMAHLVRLYLMCFDILESGEIVTFREKDHNLLMDIRIGKYLDENKQPIPEFYDMVDELEAKLDRLAKTTELPDRVDMDKVYDLLFELNSSVV